MKILGTLFAYEPMPRNPNRVQIKLLTTNPMELISITLDEGATCDTNLLQKEVEVGVTVGSYRDKPQFYCSAPPVLAKSPPVAKAG